MRRWCTGCKSRVGACECVCVRVCVFMCVCLCVCALFYFYFTFIHLTLTFILSVPRGTQGLDIIPPLNLVCSCTRCRVPCVPACTVPFQFHHSSPGGFWATSLSPSFRRPPEGYSSVVCSVFSQDMSDPVSPPPSHLLTNPLCSCHL
jgi:hypothetical protein